jgi:hypothetical protein
MKRNRYRRGPPCPEHPRHQMMLARGEHGWYFHCPLWPQCEMMGQANEAGELIGHVADAHTRRMRIDAHRAFDPLWRTKDAPMSRGDAYEWLADQMGMTRETCHIRYMSAEQCQRVVELSTARMLEHHGIHDIPGVHDLDAAAEALLTHFDPATLQEQVNPSPERSYDALQRWAGKSDDARS